MNTDVSIRTLAEKLRTMVVLGSIIIASSFFLLQALSVQAVDAAVSKVETQVTPKASYAVGEAVAFKVVKGATFGTSSVPVVLTASNGGTFSTGNLSGSCTGDFSESESIAIAVDTVNKAFCYKGTAAGVDTITAVFGSETEIVTYDITIEAASCTDGVQNQRETDVDLGGECEVILDRCLDETALNYKQEGACQYPEVRKDSYTISGYVYHDENENHVFDTAGSAEDALAGWTVTATYGERTLQTVTGPDGRYEFSVSDGTWTITQVVQSGWQNTSPTTITVMVGEERSMAVRLRSLLIPTVHAGFLPSYGPYNFGNKQEETRDNTSGTRVDREAPRGQVLGAKVSACGTLIRDYMKMGQANDPQQVKFLQAFLLGQGFSGVLLTGEFDEATDEAVRAFQEQHKAEILTPWVTAGIVGNDAPTGYVYRLTKWKINNTICPGSEPMPHLVL